MASVTFSQLLVKRAGVRGTNMPTTVTTTVTTTTASGTTTVTTTSVTSPAPPAAPSAEEGVPDVPSTKCVTCKYGSGDKVTVAMTEADFTPAWVSGVLDTEVTSFKTKLCTQGQVGVTVLILDIEFAGDVDESMPKSLAVKMHGPGEEQRKNSGAMGLYFKELYAYHDFNIKESTPVVCPEVVGIWYDDRDPYENAVLFNLVMVNLNEEYTEYDVGAGQLPSQAEWNEILAICGKQHAKYWEDTGIQKPPLAADETGVFKLNDVEDAMALSVGPGKIVEGWFDACETFMVPLTGQEALDSIMYVFDVAEHWKGENGAKIYRKAMARLAKAPMSLVHGDVNPGNIWKSKLGKEGDEKYLFADWQLLRMAPIAW